MVVPRMRNIHTYKLYINHALVGIFYFIFQPPSSQLFLAAFFFFFLLKNSTFSFVFSFFFSLFLMSDRRTFDRCQGLSLLFLSHSLTLMFNCWDFYVELMLLSEMKNFMKGEGNLWNLKVLNIMFGLKFKNYLIRTILKFSLYANCIKTNKN